MEMDASHHGFTRSYDGVPRRGSWFLGPLLSHVYASSYDVLSPSPGLCLTSSS